MANLYPRDFDDLAKRLVKDDNLYKEFNRYFNSDSNGYGYDKDKVICMMLQTSYMDTRKCKKFWDILLMFEFMHNIRHTETIVCVPSRVKYILFILLK